MIYIAKYADTEEDFDEIEAVNQNDRNFIEFVKRIEEELSIQIKDDLNDNEETSIVIYELKPVKTITVERKITSVIKIENHC